VGPPTRSAGVNARSVAPTTVFLHLARVRSIGGESLAEIARTLRAPGLAAVHQTATKCGAGGRPQYNSTAFDEGQRSDIERRRYAVDMRQDQNLVLKALGRRNCQSVDIIELCRYRGFAASIHRKWHAHLIV